MRQKIEVILHRAMYVNGDPYPEGARVAVAAHEAYEFVVLNRWASFARATDQDEAHEAAKAELQRVMREVGPLPGRQPSPWQPWP